MSTMQRVWKITWSNHSVIHTESTCGVLTLWWSLSGQGAASWRLIFHDPLSSSILSLNFLCRVAVLGIHLNSRVTSSDWELNHHGSRAVQSSSSNWNSYPVCEIYNLCFYCASLKSYMISLVHFPFTCPYSLSWLFISPPPLAHYL